MKKFDIYLIGVGGQGIGLLSEAIIRAADYRGLRVRGVDTHGLAQRGGTVTSHVRIGEGAHSPIIQEHSADLVVALERNEALRGIKTHLKDGGTIIYYDAIWQPLSVRLKKEKKIANSLIEEESKGRNIKIIKVFSEELKDSRMQNTVLLGKIADMELIPGLKKEDYKKALEDLLSGKVLEKNLELLK